MKKIIIVSRSRRIGLHYLEKLSDIFEDDIFIDAIIQDDDNLDSIMEYDLVLITTYTVLDSIMQYVSKDSKVLKVAKNIDPRGIEEIQKLPLGTEALVVNVGPKTVSESIYLIYSHGRADLELHPYYPGIDRYKEVDYILTQGEAGLAPAGFKGKIIELHNSIIDSKTYIEIIEFCKLDRTYYLKKIFGLNKINIPSNDGVSLVISERSMFENIINVLFENMNEGVLIFNEVGIVTTSSLSVQRFLNKSVHKINNHAITEIIDIDSEFLYGEETKEIVIKVRGIPLICNVLPQFTIGENTYGLIILKNYSDTEMKMHLYKQELKEKGHRTKYKISDIIGVSDSMVKLKNYAVRIAKSESTVLIFGESGTGKELFAHAIHNNSHRKKEQFVAINCSAIPDSLLESELFGYEVGAFTGAKKSGKKGLFEIANGGTLFLDEVGEIPLRLQNRLLRVLQEKEIMKVGGNSIIKTDVRVIVATNVDLKQQVRDGKFRKDLYYRLSVFPLYLPPLRDRQEDVLLIFDHMVKQKSEEMVLKDTTKEFLLNYEWDGNVRELSNCVEYLINLGKYEISIEDLPESMHFNSEIRPNIVEVKINNKESVEDVILEILYTKAREGKKVGRKQLASILSSRDYFYSEQEVRNFLLVMQEKGLVNISRGRGGTVITQEGLEMINNKVN
ncbi:sigma 54-interacting transcriptional regulator [Clostridiaceae bacterium HSG29]|nr:sigma 54-interacting transcriptional regulator [Clostridiaceae bacterium HSG29]